MFTSDYLVGKLSESRINDFLKEAEHERQAQEAHEALKRIKKERAKEFRIVKSNSRGFKRQ